MGNSCPGSRSLSDDADAQMFRSVDRVQVQPMRSSKYAHITDEAHTVAHRTHGHNFVSTFDPNAAEHISMAQLVEHYQPYEFPICPVINSDTQRLVRDSWTRIMATEFDSSESATGKVSGASYFYNHFFSQLFARLADFSRIFPDIKSRADIFSKVMGFCISIRIEELDLVRMKLKHLGQMHKAIIHHPYLFGIYASNMHSTIRHCLGEQATHDVMSAWLHLLAFILRGMLPAYFAGLNFCGHYSGAVNATSTINDKARDEVKTTEELKSLKNKLQSLQATEPPSRYGHGAQPYTPHMQQRMSGSNAGEESVMTGGRAMQVVTSEGLLSPPGHGHSSSLELRQSSGLGVAQLQHPAVGALKRQGPSDGRLSPTSHSRADRAEFSLPGQTKLKSPMEED